MHNYSAANSGTQKLYNWNTLNTKAPASMTSLLLPVCAGVLLLTLVAAAFQK